MLEDNPDFVTLLPTPHQGVFLVSVMTYHKVNDEYVSRKVSNLAMRRELAESMAKAWAAERKIEIR